MKWLFLVLSISLLAFVAAHAQSNVALGELHGSVTDPTGALVPGAKVTVRSEDTGLVRTNSTDSLGEYRFLLMPPGVYNVQVDKEGFRSQLAKGVRVTVGQIAIVNLSLEVGTATQLVEVSGEASLVESERTHQANTLEQESVQNLPINRRDYLAFTLLAPGVVDSNALADNSDFRVKQTPTSGLSFYGSNGRGNSVTVDGGEANDDGGGVRPTMSQEAVQEFQINRSNYSAELGGASGGVINIVSKSGTNQVHGSLFSFFRHDSLDATNPFANILQNGQLVRVKPPSQREQFGGSFGGPIRRDRTFVFIGAESLIRDESSVVSVFQDPSIFGPTPAQNAVLNALPAAVSTPLRGALTSSPATRALFESNSGIFPYTSRSGAFTARIDHRMNDSNQLFLRYNYSDVHETNANIQALVGASRGTRTETLDSTATLGWTHTFNPRLMNEARFQWSYYDGFTTPLEKLGPSINIAGFGFFNRDIFLPNFSILRRYEIKDSISYFHGSHNIKFGGQVLLRGNHSESHTFFPGRFQFGDLPGTLLNPALPPTFTINALQAFNLGLPQFYQQGFGDPTVASTNPYYGFFIQDSWKARPNLTFDFGLRYELDYRKPPLPTATKHFAPRFGFAWDPFNDKKTTVRGGYGIFFAPIYYQVDYVVNALNQIDGRRQIAQVFTSIQTAGAASAANIYQTLLKQGVVGIPNPARQITPDDLKQFGITVANTGPLPPLSVLFENMPDYTNPYSQQASLAVERQVAPDLAVSIGYTYVRTLKIGRAHDVNALQAPVDPTRGIRYWGATADNPTGLKYFASPLLLQHNFYESTARAFYSGMIIEVKKRFSHSLSLNGNYTFSRAIDEVVDFNSGWQPNDQTCLRCDRALSSFDQRHKVVVYGVWQMPAKFQFAPIFRANSARPFNLLAGTDLNGDRHSDTDRPPFAGRNTGIGPNFWTFDMRLGKKIPLGKETRNVEFMAEAFNLFNRLNFASINNNGVGAMPPPFNVHGRTDRSPSQPLGFTSAFDPRRFQLGVRLSF